MKFTKTLAAAALAVVLATGLAGCSDKSESDESKAQLQEAQTQIQELQTQLKETQDKLKEPE